MRFTSALFLAALFGAGCARAKDDKPETSPVVAHGDAGLVTTHAAIDFPSRLTNRIAYIPPQCFAKTHDRVTKEARNTCYTCHVNSPAPNFTNDEDLQSSLTFPPIAAKNPWTNLITPPFVHAVSPEKDQDTLLQVRHSNYFDDDGEITLARVLQNPPPAWDRNHDGRWSGFVPDVRFHFDENGFDRTPSGKFTGWRAFAYYPLPGAFLPTNGSADDVLIRLADSFRNDEKNVFNAEIYSINFAIVEALIRRTDIPIDPVDETTLGVDLNLDGKLGRATYVAFDGSTDGKTRLHYVGRARVEQEQGKLAVAPGMFPIGTELFHTVRYLDLAADGSVTLAPRMKEVRYARKTRWSDYATARAVAIKDAREQAESIDGIHDVRFQSELGVYSARGWLLQGFIESKDGALRPQSYEENAYCEGCHGGIGGTTDSIFTFARKLPSTAPAKGWFHWSQYDLRGIEEPKRQDGEYEYSHYLKSARGGDDFQANDEVAARFFDSQNQLVLPEIERLHHDISTLLLPSAARALALNRAYLAIVAEQSFNLGRDPILDATNAGIDATPTIGASTGVTRAEPYSSLVSTSVRTTARK